MSQDKPRSAAEVERAAREAAALRENLRKRKAQARARAAGPAPGKEDDPAPPPTPVAPDGPTR
ncbi:MAG TPA: hypothetical protein VGM87_18310 [Roseomonas sp.]|jgi:hypothetical protein